MTDLNCSLRGCDAALAEADVLIALLTGCREPLDPELAALQLRIAALRHEVERLRGLPGLPVARARPDRGALAAETPWAPTGGQRGAGHGSGT